MLRTFIKITTLASFLLCSIDTSPHETNKCLLKGVICTSWAVFSLALCIINIAMVANQTKECSIATK